MHFWLIVFSTCQQVYCSFKSESVGARISGVVSLRNGSESELKMAVALAGPVAISIDASDKAFIVRIFHYNRNSWHTFLCPFSLSSTVLQEWDILIISLLQVQVEPLHACSGVRHLQLSRLLDCQKQVQHFSNFWIFGNLDFCLLLAGGPTGERRATFTCQEINIINVELLLLLPTQSFSLSIHYLVAELYVICTNNVCLHTLIVVRYIIVNTMNVLW